MDIYVFATLLLVAIFISIRTCANAFVLGALGWARFVMTIYAYAVVRSVMDHLGTFVSASF